jgi:hypothetical protein
MDRSHRIRSATGMRANPKLVLHETSASVLTTVRTRSTGTSCAKPG